MGDDADDPSLLRDRRIQYETAGLDVGDLAGHPIEQWHRWYREAFNSNVAEPNAMVLATVDLHGHPDARTVLVRGADRAGFTFFTNYESAKSHHLTARPVAAATFAWLELHRQVRIRGAVGRVGDAENDAYFATRPRDSQIGAWASPQSEVIRDRAELDALVAGYEQRFADVERIPRPAHWGGWRLVPDELEFWQGRAGRLHDRLRYRRDGERWTVHRLAP